MGGNDDIVYDRAISPKESACNRDIVCGERPLLEC